MLLQIFLEDEVLYLVLIALALIIATIIIVSSVKKSRKNRDIEKTDSDLAEPSDEEKSVEEEKPEEEEKPVEEEQPVEEEKPVEPTEEKPTEEKPVEPAEEEDPEQPVESLEPVEEKPVEPAEEQPEEVKTQMKGKYEVYQDSDFYKYTLKASNGEVLVESEVYTSLDGVYSAIEAVKKNVETGIVTISKDKKGMYQFKLFARNHRVLVASANYPTERGALKASESFKRFAVNANIVELDPSEVVSKITPIEIGEVENKNGGKIVVEKEDGSYAYKLYASNNELMCTSEDYKTKNSAISGIDTFKAAIKDGKFYLVKDKRGLYQFKLYSAANRIIVLGETYKTKTQAKQSAIIVCSYVENASFDYLDKDVEPQEEEQ